MPTPPTKPNPPPAAPARPPVQPPPSQAHPATPPNQPPNRPQGATAGPAMTYPPGSRYQAPMERDSDGPDPQESKLRVYDVEEPAGEEGVVTIAQEQRARSEYYQERGVEVVKAENDERDPADIPRTVPGVSPTTLEPPATRSNPRGARLSTPDRALMPITDFGSDWNSPYRMPQGWTPYPDGSVGPSSGLPDWLKQLIPAQGAGMPYAPQGQGGPPTGGAGPGGLMPGGGVMGRQATTPGAPSMGFPAQGGPQVMPPQNSTIPNNRAVGPFTGGTSTENMPGGSPGGGASSWADPRNWFRANPNATFQQGQPMGPDVTGGGAPSPLSFLAGGGMNPYARGGIAAAGVMQPTPTASDQAPTNMWNQRPSGVGGMPGPQVTNPQQPMHPSSAVYPSWPSGAAPATTMANAPPGNPSQTPRPNTPYPPRRPPAGSASAPTGPATGSSNPRFGLYQSQVPSGMGPLSRNPIYTTLNLFGRS